MSRAASTVETWRDQVAGQRLAQPAAEPAHLAHERRDLGQGVGVGVPGDVGVELGVVEAVDRAAVAGAARVEADDVEAVDERSPERPRSRCSAYDVPGAPGPPGLTTSEPTRSPGFEAGRLSSASSIVSPSGLLVVERHLEAWRTRCSPQPAQAEPLGVEAAPAPGSGGSVPQGPARGRRWGHRADGVTVAGGRGRRRRSQDRASPRPRRRCRPARATSSPISQRLIRHSFAAPAARASSTPAPASAAR